MNKFQPSSCRPAFLAPVQFPTTEWRPVQFKWTGFGGVQSTVGPATLLRPATISRKRTVPIHIPANSPAAPAATAITTAALIILIVIHSKTAKPTTTTTITATTTTTATPTG